jgi:predicted NAD/FAD-dependent oxidoreductase
MSNLTVTNPGDLGVLVVGAGISGLTLARLLAQNGVKVSVFEKSRGLGGRLASRRGGGHVWDHGIPSLNPEDIPPEVYVDWKKLEILQPRKDQEKLSWICPEGITQLPKALEKGLTVYRETKIETIRVGPGGKVWMIGDDSGGWHYGSQLILAVPAPQALALLDGAFPHQMVSLKESLSRIQYRPTLTVLATVNRKKFRNLNLKPFDPIETIVDNGEKGVLQGEGSLTIYLNEKYSLKNFEVDENKVIAEITKLLGKRNQIEIHQQTLKRWRYSQVTQALEESYLSAKLTSPLFVIGDGFCGGGLKGALLSATALADKLLHPPKIKESWRQNGKTHYPIRCPR